MRNKIEELKSYNTILKEHYKLKIHKLKEDIQTMADENADLREKLLKAGETNANMAENFRNTWSSLCSTWSSLENLSGYQKLSPAHSVHLPVREVQSLVRCTANRASHYKTQPQMSIKHNSIRFLSNTELRI